MNEILKPEQLVSLRQKVGSRKFRKMCKAYEENTGGFTYTSNTSKGRVVINEYHLIFRNRDDVAFKGMLDDIVTGVCNLDHYSQDHKHTELNASLVEEYGSIREALIAFKGGDYKAKPMRSVPLSKNMCYFLLENHTLTTGYIMDTLNLEKRQAQRYLRACKLIIGAISNEINLDKLSDAELEYTKDEDEIYFNIMDNLISSGNLYS